MSRRRWTSAELATLRELYADTLTQQIADLVGHPLRSVYCKALSLGLKKSTEFIATHCRCSDGRLGMKSRFKPGQQPWNKGINYFAGGRAMQTQFTPGSRPFNHMPIGSERVTKDGTLQRKVTDTGYPPHDWISVHSLIWTQRHGPIPAGHIVVFKDRNNRNFDLDNLELITRSENMRRNSYHRYPKEIAQAIQLRGVLNRKINERAQREEQD